MQYLPLGFNWPGLLLPLVTAWYIITEMGSILENAVKLGAHVPSWLVSLMEASVNLMDTAGGALGPTTEPINPVVPVEPPTDDASVEDAVAASVAAIMDGNEMSDAVSGQPPTN